MTGRARRRVVDGLLVVTLLAATAIGWPSRAMAAEAGQGSGPPTAWQAIGVARLDQIRGGYVLPSGLRVSFGFERLAWINGELVSSLRVDIPDIANITRAQARDLARIGEAQRVQVGPGNAFDGVGAGLVIQNTLDGQRIQAQTTLDVGVDTMAMLQALRFAETMGAGAAGAVGGP